MISNPFASSTKAIGDFLAAFLSRGTAHHDKSDSITDLTNAIRGNPGYSRAYCNRGYAYLNKGDYDKAIADYTEAIRLNPGHAETYCNRGYAYFEKGDYDKAIADLTKAVRVNPQYALAYNNRGVAYDKKGEKSKAEADFAEAKRLGFANCLAGGPTAPCTGTISANDFADVLFEHIQHNFATGYKEFFPDPADCEIFSRTGETGVALL